MLFSEELFPQIMDNFELSAVVNINHKRKVIKDWTEKITANRLQKQKETSVATDFVNAIFGDVLDYHYGNPYKWNLEKELKTKVDGKRPDGAIGFFEADRSKDLVSGVIEMKEFGEDLDGKQKRAKRQTPVEQGMMYAAKFGSSCKWVFVSNMQEIRLYRAGDELACEVFLLEELTHEETFKKFLFLCSRERLISPIEKSPVDRLLDGQAVYNRFATAQVHGHIVDQIYFSLKRFDGVSYFDPNIFANAKPFHQGKQFVWHYYRCILASAEPGINEFFANVTVEEEQINIAEEFQSDAVKAGVLEFEKKAIWIIKRLNQLLVCSVHCYENVDTVHKYLEKSTVIGEGLDHELSDYADQLRTYDISLGASPYIENSLLPLLDKYQFKVLLRQLYAREGTPAQFNFESLYLHVFLGTNDFKTGYTIANQLANTYKEVNPFEYFISLVNKKLLHNLVQSYYSLHDQEAILDELKMIDLIEAFCGLSVYDPDVRKVFVDIIDNKYRIRANEEIDYLTDKLQRVKESFERGPEGSFPNYSSQLFTNTLPYFAARTLNHIIDDHFYQHRNLCTKLVNACLLSYSINEAYHGRLQGINHAIFNWIVMDVSPSDFEKMLKRHGIVELNFDPKDEEVITEAIISYLNSRRSDSIYFSASSDDTMDRGLAGYRFRNKYFDGFDNILLLLSLCKTSSEKGKRIFKELGYFIQVSDKLYGQHLEHLPAVLMNERLGYDVQDIGFILKSLLGKIKLNDKRPFRNSISHLICQYPEYLESNQELWGGYMKMIHKGDIKLRNVIHFYANLWPDAQKEWKALVEESLKLKFSPYLYIAALNNAVVAPEQGDWFDKLIDWANHNRNFKPYKLYNGIPHKTSGHFTNFLMPIYIQDIRLDPTKFESALDWQRWAVAPHLFDADKFKVEWLYLFYQSCFHQKFAKIDYVVNALTRHLKDKPDSKLTPVFLKYYL